MPLRQLQVEINQKKPLLHNATSRYEKEGAYHWLECDRNSPQYNPPLEARYTLVLEKIARAECILDVGCGDGYLMNLVAPLCNRTIGIDYDFAATKLATKKLPQPIKCKVMQASSYQLPFYDEKFDIALLTDVIEHLEMPERCVKEIGRVLTPDGTLLLTTLNWRPDRKWDWRHIREYRPLELEALLRSFFSKVTLSFFWPLVWSKMYATKIGWKAIRLFARHFYNPFLRQGSNPRHFGQILAICQCPR